ncbi:hypothetical protein PanWU01x14_102970 [Parasponia andersonii]|uniref:Uncharacterized protein n=1 Tax=Parasponia andersonii TaxID=3476 RepID=A0A2P5D2H6_PARAD|nr:hypothetical protein PanWU01x14_102970 [Parasponia andersonii]
MATDSLSTVAESAICKLDLLCFISNITGVISDHQSSFVDGVSIPVVNLAFHVLSGFPFHLEED